MKPFRLNKRNAMLLGVCSGIADSTGLGVTLVRVGVIAFTLFGLFPWTIIAYLAAAWLAKPAAEEASAHGSARGANSGAGRSDVELRVAELERRARGGDSALAREIEGLRHPALGGAPRP